MATPRPRSARPVADAQARRAGILDPTADAVARREEEFRRFLVSVVGPAFGELRAALKTDGYDVRIRPAAVSGRPSEAGIEVSRGGRLAFAYALRAEIAPERAVVLKRVAVPDVGDGSDPPRAAETPLVAGTAHASDARAVTRADVVASVQAELRALLRPARPR